MEHISKVLADYPKSTGHRNKSLESNKVVDYEMTESCEEQKSARGYAPNPHCKVCHSSGFVHPLLDSGKPDYAQVIDCQAKGCIVDQKRIYQSTQPSVKEKGVAKFNSFDNFKPVLGAETTLEAFRDIAFNAQAPPLLMVYGTTGCGKSHLCEATVLELANRGIDCRLWPVPDLVRKLHQSIPDSTTDQLISGLIALPALILDEWGQNYGSEWEEQKLEEIFVARERAELITIITTNLEPSAPGQKPKRGQVPERVVSRFRDRTQARLILNAAPDYRPKKKAKRSKG